MSKRKFEYRIERVQKSDARLTEYQRSSVERGMPWCVFVNGAPGWTFSSEAGANRFVERMRRRHGTKEETRKEKQ